MNENKVRVLMIDEILEQARKLGEKEFDELRLYCEKGNRVSLIQRAQEMGIQLYE